MIEYLYDVIRATANTDTTITADITDDAGNPITENCSLMLHNCDGSMIVSVDGVFYDNSWSFTIPADITKERLGRHFYCICAEDRNLCFKQPIYFV